MEKARSEFDAAMSKHRALCKKKGADPELIEVVRHVMACACVRARDDMGVGEWVVIVFSWP